MNSFRGCFIERFNSNLTFDGNIVFSENAKNLCNPLNDPDEETKKCSMACIDGNFIER